MKSTEFLRAAIDVQAARAAEYDQPEGERSMGRTVQAFNAITGRELTEAEGWLFLQVLKDVRQWSAKGYHHDSALDGVAYSALKAEALHGEQKTDTPSALPGADLLGKDPGQWMRGDQLRGSSGTDYEFVGIEGRYAKALREGQLDQALLSCLTWVSRPDAPPVPRLDLAGLPELWQKGDVLRFVAQSGIYFTPGNEYSVAVVGQTRIFIVDDSSREHPVTAEFARSNFKWMSRP